jgi:hypothetical protein
VGDSLRQVCRDLFALFDGQAAGAEDEEAA